MNKHQKPDMARICDIIIVDVDTELQGIYEIVLVRHKIN
jgi:hypothetical protein